MKPKKAPEPLDKPGLFGEAIAEFRRTRQGCSDVTWKSIGKWGAKTLKDPKASNLDKSKAALALIEQRKVEVSSQKFIFDAFCDMANAQGNQDGSQGSTDQDALFAGLVGFVEHHIEGAGRELHPEVIRLERPAEETPAASAERRYRRADVAPAVAVTGEAVPVAKESAS